MTRKTLNPIENVQNAKPATTAAVRKAAQTINREAALAHPLAADHTDWLIRVARGEVEAPSAVQTLALKTVNELLLGTEESPNKRAHEAITINITGVGAEAGITIDGESTAADSSPHELTDSEGDNDE